MGEDVALFYECEGRFSLKLRGGQLFSYLYKFLIKHRWFKTNEYSIEENRNSICFLKHNALGNDGDDSIEGTSEAQEMDSE